MATHPPNRSAPPANPAVIQWLLDADPAIRWQALRDLLGAPAAEVAAARYLVLQSHLGLANHAPAAPLVMAAFGARLMPAAPRGPAQRLLCTG